MSMSHYTHVYYYNNIIALSSQQMRKMVQVNFTAHVSHETQCMQHSPLIVLVEKLIPIIATDYFLNSL
jgi:hypothetical protein